VHFNDVPKSSRRRNSPFETVPQPVTSFWFGATSKVENAVEQVEDAELHCLFVCNCVQNHAVGYWRQWLVTNKLSTLELSKVHSNNMYPLP